METLSAQKLEQLGGMLSATSSPVILVHQHPDGDAVGSAVAMAVFIKQAYGTAPKILLPDEAAYTLDFLQEIHPVIIYSRKRSAALKAIASADLILCLDCASLERTGELRDAAVKSPAPRILIDHHLSPREDEFGLVFSETEISSACELLYHVLNGLKRPECLVRSCLEAILTGITTDTNNFANSVFPTTLTTVSEILEAGVDRDAILNRLYNQYRENRVRAMGFLLSRKMSITDEGVAIIFLNGHLNRRFALREGETEGLVNIPLSIDRVRMSIFLKEEGNLIRVSIRSKKGTSANLMAQNYFNGGGHENAAGGRLVRRRGLSSYREITDYVRRACKEFFAA